MKIVADENMPGLDLPPDIGLVRLPGRALRRTDVKDADALLVRSVTRVDEGLLEGTRVRFVGSATIGTDHVDRAWLTARGVEFVHAPGCNARAVAEYVLGAILDWLVRDKRSPEGLSIGIVGLGNVGRDVARLAKALGLTVLPCDLPRQQAGESEPWPWVGLDEALSADVVTLHVPLERTGRHPTFHLLDAARLETLRKGQLVINTCRGPVVDNEALLTRLSNAHAPDVVLDVWESEPEISLPLFRRVWRGTPHIAGYSLEGKLRGSAMVLEAFARWANLKWRPAQVEAPRAEWEGDVESLDDLRALLRARYQLERDHLALETVLNGLSPASGFDDLRRDYPVRHEMAGIRVKGKVAECWQDLLSRLGVGSAPCATSG